MFKYKDKVTITFPTYNGWSDTRECLKSLTNLNYPKKSLEIVVVDNNSSDQTPSKIKKFFPFVKVIEQKENLGYAKAVNIVARNSNSKYILFSNNDIVLDKNYINSMIELAQTDAKIGIIGGMVYRKAPRGKIGFNGLRINPYLGYHQYSLKNLDKIQDCDLPPAGGFFVKSSIFKKVGLLDENFFLFFEDIDFCLRAKRVGYKIVYNPHSIAYHGHSKSIYRENFYTIVYQGYKSKWRCILKNASPLQIITSFITELLILIVYNIKTKPKTFHPVINAIVWNLKNLRVTLKARKHVYSKNQS